VNIRQVARHSMASCLPLTNHLHRY